MEAVEVIDQISWK